MDRFSHRGQSLIELVVAIGIGILLIVGAIGALTVSLRLESQSSHSQPALELAGELSQRLHTIANNDWHALDGIATSSQSVTNQYKISTTTTFYAIAPGYTNVTLNAITYRQYFLLEDVFRDASDSLVSSGGIFDPSTRKVTLVAEWDEYGQTSDVRFVSYLTRIRNRLWTQTNWAGGPGLNGPSPNPGPNFASETNIKYDSAGEITINDLTANLAATSGNGIDPVYRYARNDVIGWLDFGAYNNVTFAPNSSATYYGSSSVGYIALDCATSPGGNICEISPFGVKENGSGILSGFGWNDTIGWISFNCDHTGDVISQNNCASQGGFDYNVSIDQTTGFFYGWAWNDAVGWISFNCDHKTDGTLQPENLNICSTSRGGTNQSDYAVKTGASTVSTANLVSTILDTTRAPGVSINSLTWNGTQPVGTNVLFQIATGNDAGNMPGFVGPDGTANTFYRPIAPGLLMKINKANHPDAQYLRYMIFLESDPSQTNAPTVQDIQINYTL